VLCNDRDWDKQSETKQTCECLQLPSFDGKYRAWLDAPLEEAKQWPRCLICHLELIFTMAALRLVAIFAYPDH
jgi:hypothetical protein